MEPLAWVYLIQKNLVYLNLVNNQFWSSSESSFLGIFEIRTTESLDSENIISTILIADANGALNIRSLDVHSFKLNDSIQYNNILRLGWFKINIIFNTGYVYM